MKDKKLRVGNTMRTDDRGGLDGDDLHGVVVCGVWWWRSEPRRVGGAGLDR